MAAAPSLCCWPWPGHLPHPGFRFRHPIAGAFPPASRILPPQPNNNKTPRLAQSPGRGGTMSQRVRRNGSPTPAGSLGGGAVTTAGGSGSRLQPMRATVPFQLKQQQQQHGSPTRSNGGGGGGNNNGGCCGGASGPSGGGGSSGGGAPRTASRSTSPTRGGGSAAARTSPTVATQTGASATSTRGTSPTRGAAPGARGSPPRPQPPPPLLGTVSSPCSSPTHLWTGEVSAAPPPARVRHRRRSPEQSRSSPERRSPSAPVCKAGTCWGPRGEGKGSRAPAATARGLQRCRGAGVAGGGAGGGARAVQPRLPGPSRRPQQLPSRLFGLCVCPALVSVSGGAFANLVLGLMR